jgi:hypothetical protein
MPLYLGIANNGTFVSADDYSLQDSNGEHLDAEQLINKLKIFLDGTQCRLTINQQPSKENE